MGRPTKYKKAFCKVVIEKMAEGYSKEAVAGFLGIAKDTLYSWVKKYPEFSDAISIGESKSRLFWEKLMIDHVVYSRGGPRINNQVLSLNMKNRFRRSLGEPLHSI